MGSLKKDLIRNSIDSGINMLIFDLRMQKRTKKLENLIFFEEFALKIAMFLNKITELILKLAVCNAVDWVKTIGGLGITKSIVIHQKKCVIITN